MSASMSFGLTVGVVGVAGLLAVLSNRLGAWTRIPVPALFLGAAAVTSDLVPALGRIPAARLEDAVTVALVLILFDGGLHLGWRKVRPVLGGVGLVGVAGTFLTAGAVALCAHGLFGFDWRTALLIGTALAPTDPAVVFSVLAGREITGPAGTLIEGESGANDPVGIALLLALLAVHPGAPGFSVAGAAGSVIATFTIQLVVGLAVGIAGGLALGVAMRRFRLPSGALYPLRTLAAALAVYGLAAFAHGSGFLAVLVAGVLVGDGTAGDTAVPFGGEIRQFHSALSSLAEIVAFTLLGLSVSVRSLGSDGELGTGLLLAVLLCFVIRPVLVGSLLLTLRRLTGGERVFIAWAGLKGAVPILLGVLATSGEIAGVRDSRVYDVIVIGVVFSVLVQGSTVPVVARWCRVPMAHLEQRPFGTGLRFAGPPDPIVTFSLAPGSPAIGAQIGRLGLPATLSVSLLVREGRPVAPLPGEVLRAGDEVVVVGDPDEHGAARELFAPTPPLSG